MTVGPSEERPYWRSLRQRREASSDTDPEPAAGGSPPEGLSRRAAVGLLGASMAMAGVACRRPVERIVPFVEPPEDLRPGVPLHYATTMALAGTSYGLLVESHDGRPIKVEGNELHPASAGAANAWMQAAILGLYDPDRSRAPRGRSVRSDGTASTFDARWEEVVELWRRRGAELEARGGRGLAVLSEAYSSPSMARLAERLRERFPEALWQVHEPLGDQNAFVGLELAAGRALRPVYHLDRAATAVALDADLLATESDALRHARGWSAARRVEKPGDEMSRLYAVESHLSVTGAAADHRLSMRSDRVAPLLAALAAELQRLGLPLELGVSALSLPEELAAKVRWIARDLAAAGEAAVVVAGRRQPPAVHAAAFLVNLSLGAVGRTVTLHEPVDSGWEEPGGLASLTEAMRQGAVSTLVILGGNPLLTAPAELDFAAALDYVELSLHLSLEVNETSERVSWHLPRAHFLESWGDSRSADGTPSLRQPLIAPLHSGRSAIELVRLLAADRETSGHSIVRGTWLETVLGGDGFEGRWDRTLHDGCWPEGAPAPVEEVSPRWDAVGRGLAAACAAAAAGRGLEVTFQPSSAVFDGRFANNGWLQEMPDPITKLTWDNAAVVAPRTASELGVATGDRVTLRLRGTELEAPVLAVPGQAPGSVALPLGYGRWAAGRVGNGVGFNAYRLRVSAAPFFDDGLEIVPTGRRQRLVTTQEHGSLEGRALVREGTLEQYRQDPRFAVLGGESAEPPRLWAEPAGGNAQPQWGMTIDLSSCLGCGACVVACQSENNVPIVGREQVALGREMHWLRIDRYFVGEVDTPTVAFQPVPCMHCETAPCEQVCPVAATVHDREGLNVMVYNRCIGTRYCSNNCPYKVRRFNFFNFTRELPELVQLGMNPDVTVRSRGVMEKCTYCLQRIQRAKRRAKLEERPLADGDVRTACQQTCPTEAIAFGDLREAGSRVQGLKGNARRYDLLAELNTRPRTSYLARLRNPNPSWGEG